MVFGHDPFIGVLQCWLSPFLNGLREPVAMDAGGHGVSFCSSVVSPKKWAKSVGNCSVLPRSLVRSKWTCFLLGPCGEHFVLCD